METSTASSPTLHHATSNFQVALVLLVLGGFCLFGSLAILMRTSMARGNGQPIPNNPYAGVIEKTTRAIARNEREMVPVYQTMTKGFAVLGVIFIISSGVTAFIIWA